MACFCFSFNEVLSISTGQFDVFTIHADIKLMHHSLQILVYMIACTYVYMCLLEYISVGMLYLYNIFRNIVAAVM